MSIFGSHEVSKTSPRTDMTEVRLVTHLLASRIALAIRNGMEPNVGRPELKKSDKAMTFLAS